MRVEGALERFLVQLEADGCSLLKIPRSGTESRLWYRTGDVLPVKPALHHQSIASTPVWAMRDAEGFRRGPLRWHLHR